MMDQIPIVSISIFLLFQLIISSHGQYSTQCPAGIRLPCSCASTRYEPVFISCDNAFSLDAVLESLGQPVFNLVIDTLVISNTPIDHLPAYAFKGHATRRLILRNNRLSSIDQSAFDGPLRTILRELEIRNNYLTAIPQTGLPRLQSLNTLILGKNRITNIPKRAFELYESKAVLRKLDFSSNQLHDLDPETFIGGLNSVQEINLDKNFFTSVPTQGLKTLQTLEDLSFGVNQIIDIPVDSLPFPNLKSLSLEVNRIEKLDPDVFQYTHQLLYLYLSANNFTQFDSSMFKNLPNLKVLAIGNNAIDTLRADSFRYIPELVRLEMSECRIANIDPGVFPTIPKVQVIVMNKNRLTRIDTNMFQGLSELYSLDLKGNAISYIGDRAFSGLRSLRHLDLSTNQLSTLSHDTFIGTFERTSPPTTRVMYIYENPWSCDERLDWFRRWLRDNVDIMIDAPGYPPTVCLNPDWLRGWPIRSVNPTSIPINWTQAVTEGILDGGFQDSLEGPLSDYTKLSTVNLTAMILGIVLGIFLLTLLLLIIVRYFVSKNRRDMKENEEYRRQCNSALNAYQPGLTPVPVYPSPPLETSPGGRMDQPVGPGSMRRPGSRYFLNRPWYWWF